MQKLIDELLTKIEAAERARCSVRTIDYMIARGELEAVKFGRRMVRIRAGDLEAAFKPYGGVA